MRVGIFRQGYGLPSQGLQLRGSNHLVDSLVSCTMLHNGQGREGRTGDVSNLKTLDITPYVYQVQWQPGGGGGLGVATLPLPQSTPWGAGSEGFGASNDEWLLYNANEAFIANFPTGANARTLSALCRRTADTTGAFFGYGGDITNHGGGEFFGLYYVSGGTLLLNSGTSTISVPFPFDRNWHLVSIVVPFGVTHMQDVLFYVDGMNIAYTGAPNLNPINTFTGLNRRDWSYGIGNVGLNFSGGTANSDEFHGWIAAAWVWKRALSPAEQNVHWSDPFQMIARPRSLSNIDVLSPPPPGVPTCSIISAPGTIVVGGTSTLTWTTTNTPDTATIDNGIGPVNTTGGSVVVSPVVTTTYTLTVSNISGTSTCRATVIVQPLPPGPLSGQCNNPPVGKVGVPYSVTFTSSGGTAPFTFTITSGALPFGLTLAPNGVVSGTPTTSGIYFFTVTIVDSLGVVVSFNCNIPIAC